uniref:long-chain-fatty-acid--CoA ligase n=2 Tax=Hirondellea gigas TaxID=1518452 RepID=A0A6A7G7W4_9CRUS
MAEFPVNPCSGPDQVLPATSLKTWTIDTPVLLQMSTSGYASAVPLSMYSMMKAVAEDKPLRKAMALQQHGTWKSWNYRDYFEESCTVAKAFIALGLERSHGVCLMGNNHPHWLIANFGSIFAGGVSTGVYTSNSPITCRHMAKDCRAQVLVLENQHYIDKFLPLKQFLPHVKVIVQYSGTPTMPGVLSWQELLAIGSKQSDDAFNNRLKLQAVNQCCSLIYTSGTTGLPKGVMTSQDAITWCVTQIVAVTNPQRESKDIVSYLPLSHIAGLMSDCYAAVAMASTVFFTENDILKGGSLIDALRQIEPTGLLSVPRVWEKLYDKLQEYERSLTPTKKKMGDWCKQQILNYYDALSEGRELSSFEQVRLSMARKAVANVKTSLGLSKAVNLVSGGAPLSPDIQKYFMSMDMPVRDSYALSETAAIGFSNVFLPGNFRSGSLGKVVRLTSMEIKRYSADFGEYTDKEGEICFKGRSIFMGYLNQEDVTNEVILDDGWMRTGDLGYLDKDGYLFLSGRVKEIIITAGGENVPPVFIESAIKKLLPFLSNTMLVGDRRKYLSILLTVKCGVEDKTGMPNEALGPSVVAWCAERGVTLNTVSEFRREIERDGDGPLAMGVQDAIDRYNSEHAISNAQKVQRWTFLPHDFSLATGELNNFLKLKRKVTARMYADVIDDLYGDVKSKL